MEKNMEGYTCNKCVNVELRSIDCGVEECAPSHSYGPAIRQHCLVHYVESGKGIFEINGKTHIVTRGQIFYIPPKVVTYYEADKNDPWVYRWVGIEGANVEKYFENGGITADNAVLNADKKTSGIMQDILKKCRDEEHSLEVSALVYEFLHVIGARAPESGRKTNGELYVEKAKDYVHIYLYRKVGVAEVSDYLNIDRSYLTALFKKTVGMSPQKYIMKEKMKAACEYLSTTDYDVSYIAQSVGYDDLFVFSHAFKRVMGVSPREYRSKL